GRHLLARERVLYRAAAALARAGAEVDRLLAARDGGRDARPLPPDPPEERGEAVEVVLAPHLERVVVALRTVEPHAEEELAHHRGQLVRLPAVAVEHRGPVGPGAAAGGDDLADELVVGLVAAEA